ncbi:Phage tail tube protein [Thermanaeromonas toyohensis ToBE]|uniref:Phage tail tube protein n=1 Tax=Thermanaeromonas toyohensis ToBE TaxID=698762 RepID=A0A1W1VXG7_9FIRM|nr:phage tail tube protein [Thermanaeromonas toyohensis]SMB97943.1 Phage tail tube protein [Thermanaeromonas toyohensis ToBE]
MAGIDASRVINGTYGAVYLDGRWLTNFTRCEIRDEYDFAELKLSGDRRTKHKMVGVKGSGTIAGFKVTSDLIKALLDNPTRTFEIISKLADPESYGMERIRVPQVKFNRNQLANWRTGEVVEEEWEFVYDGEPELLDPIVAP